MVAARLADQQQVAADIDAVITEAAGEVSTIVERNEIYNAVYQRTVIVARQKIYEGISCRIKTFAERAAQRTSDSDVRRQGIAVVRDRTILETSMRLNLEALKQETLKRKRLWSEMEWTEKHMTSDELDERWTEGQRLTRLVACVEIKQLLDEEKGWRVEERQLREIRDFLGAADAKSEADSANVMLKGKGRELHLMSIKYREEEEERTREKRQREEYVQIVSFLLLTWRLSFPHSSYVGWMSSCVNLLGGGLYDRRPQRDVQSLKCQACRRFDSINDKI